MRKLKHISRRKNKQRKIIIGGIFSLLLIMTVGYAAMQTNIEINAKGNIVKKATGGEAILDNVDVVTSGDGLYKDVYEDNVYTYRGANPNNYVTFNDETWRIISVNTEDNTIKIMRNVLLENRRFDTPSGRYQGNSGYCNYSSGGCNIWGSSSTLYDTNLSPITTLAREVGETKYALPTTEAEVNTYLNTTYYNDNLNETAKSMVKQDTVYKSGVLKWQSGQTTSTDITQVNDVKWKGKVALIDATEYVRASTNGNCTGVYAYRNSSCYNNSSTHNWMYLNNYWWTMSPSSDSTSGPVWLIYSTGYLYYDSASFKYGVRPVVTLSPEVQITGGDGTENNPFNLSLN